jgi:Dolichyl-phosphate-mannose-protein mannosyltransferase
MESNDTSGTQGRSFGFWAALAVLVCLAHAVFLLRHFEPAITGPDADGYFAQGRLIAEQGRASFQRESGLQYINMHWLAADGDRFVSRYPPGFPLLLAGALKVGGPALAMRLNAVFASVTLFGLFLVASRWAGPGWGLVAAVVMAANPSTNGWVYMGDAHPSVSLLLVWGLWLLARWADKPTLGRAVAAGLVLGSIPALRYSEALYGVGFAWFVLVTWRRGGAPFRSVLAAAAGAAIPLALLVVHEALIWGSAGRTGYTAGKPLFTWDYFTQKALPYLQTLQTGPGWIAAFGFAGMAYLGFRRETRREGVMLALLVFPITGLYAAYFFYDATQRFLMPTFYLFAIAAVCLFKAIADSNPAGGRAAAAACLAIALLTGGLQSWQSAESQRLSTASLAKAAAEIEARVEPGAVVIAPQNIAQHLDFLGRWRLADLQFFGSQGGGGFGGMGGPPMGGGGPPGGPGMGGPGGPGGDQGVMQELMQTEERRQTRAKYLGQDGETLDQVWTDLTQWTGGKAFYWIGDKSRITETLGDYGKVTVLATIDSPRGGMGPGGRMGGPPGMGGMGPPRGGFGGPGMGPPGGGPGGFPGMRGGPFGPGGAAAKLVVAKVELKPS